MTKHESNRTLELSGAGRTHAPQKGKDIMTNTLSPRPSPMSCSDAHDRSAATDKTRSAMLTMYQALQEIAMSDAFFDGERRLANIAREALIELQRRAWKP